MTGGEKMLSDNLLHYVVVIRQASSRIPAAPCLFGWRGVLAAKFAVSVYLYARSWEAIYCDRIEEARSWSLRRGTSGMVIPSEYIKSRYAGTGVEVFGDYTPYRS